MLIYIQRPLIGYNCTKYIVCHLSKQKSLSLKKTNVNINVIARDRMMYKNKKKQLTGSYTN